ncbi:hypothetical protein FOZ60_000254 [Perkinsus olseni]|uniref:Uncharacterized protein n=1 Tax=Perkinsus olseni TaxID=32597 RepID=A0A7J6P2P9_PEROL|nr:hypothetical protein FOZ60_000254 [Perkinsus olseni]
MIALVNSVTCESGCGSCRAFNDVTWCLGHLLAGALAAIASRLREETFLGLAKGVSKAYAGVESRAGKICKFEAPYESWKPEEPKRKRLVKGGRIFDFRLESSARVRELDVLSFSNWRFQGLLQRAPSAVYTDAIRHYGRKPEAGFLSEPLRSDYDSLYNEDDDTGDSRVCVAAVEGLWRKMCKDGNLPENEKWNEDRVMHILMDGVCSLNKKKQKMMIEGISSGKVRGDLIDPYVTEERERLMELLGNRVYMDDFLKPKGVPHLILPLDACCE